jgi:polyisoprenoid-binding protein YceI
MSSPKRAPLALMVPILLVTACPEAPPPEATAPTPEAPADATEIVRPSDRQNDDGGGVDDSGGPSADGGDGSAGGGTPTTPGEEPGQVDGGDEGGSTTPGDGAPVTPPLHTAVSSSADSLLYVLVWRDPSALANSLAHDHVVRATDWAGTLQFRVGDAASCAVDIDVDSATLLNDEPAMRAEVGLEGTLDDDDRETVREHMLGEGQLEAQDWPTLSFTSTSCSGDLDGEGTLAITGDLTIRDETRSVTWTVDYEVEADGRMFARGDLTIAQTDFGITPYSAFFGTVRVADDVDLTFDLVGSPTTR